MSNKHKQVADFLNQFNDDTKRELLDFGRLQAIENLLFDKGLMTEEEHQNYIVDAIYNVHLKDE